MRQTSRFDRVEQGRAAREHALNRELNERLSRRVADGNGAMPWLLVCECGRRGCAETVELTRLEYAAARSHPSLYIVAPGHESTGVTEIVLEVSARFAIVELLPSAAAAAVTCAQPPLIAAMTSIRERGSTSVESCARSRST